MTRVFVGNLPLDVQEREIEDLFYKYGRIRDIDIKRPSRPPAFCFVEFDDPRDADDAVRGRDRIDFDGQPLRVEISHGGRRDRVIVEGLPETASWQDLKDFMRSSGDVVFTDVVRERNGTKTGIVEYSLEEDMRRAVRELDDTEFKNPFDRVRVRVREDRGRRDDRDDRDDRRPRRRSYSRGRSDSRSPRRGRSDSRGRSYPREDEDRRGERRDERDEERRRSEEREDDRPRNGEEEKEEIRKDED